MTKLPKVFEVRPWVDLRGNREETYRMLQGAEFIKNTAEGPHITLKTQAHNDGWLFIDTMLQVLYKVLFVSQCLIFRGTLHSHRLEIWHYILPLIIVRFVVPDFWSHVIRRAHVCMSVGLWAAMQTQANRLKYWYIGNIVTHLIRTRVLLCLFRIHAEPKSPSLIVASSVRKIFCSRHRREKKGFIISYWQIPESIYV